MKVRGSCTSEEGYWIKVAKSMSGKGKVSNLFVKSVYNKWIKNHDDIQGRVNIQFGKRKEHSDKHYIN